ncbi:MAG: hypothetical protein E6K41_13475 [Gammaproteobacteria bacterium]|nr:MAG: hypothetical protein E6K41_13475 [Gammaproteobacteria bacterium]TLZ55588.1 MAG: hypothetical protein E6K22_03465 [Gammaproteobacteria bacterium]TLZ60537.1 MAG: hypothetical protein E6K20_11955 [Gammaproteobacteria bacterium]
MRLRFHIDPATGAPHIYKHRVSETEVEEVPARAGEDRAGRDGTRIAIGPTLSGRVLRVVYVPDPQPESHFVITGFELRGKAALAYRRRRRRKRR